MLYFYLGESHWHNFSWARVMCILEIAELEMILLDLFVKSIMKKKRKHD